MSEFLRFYEDMIWIHLDKDGQNISNAIAEVAWEKNLPISFDVRPAYIRVIAPSSTVEKLKSIEKDQEVSAIRAAEIGSVLGRPRLNFQTWCPEFRRKVEAEWWSAKGNKKRALKVLQGLQPLSFEDKKQLVKKILQDEKSTNLS